MSKIIIEFVGEEKCLNGRKLYLVYASPSLRKFAPQHLMDEYQLERRVNAAFEEGMDITLYEEYGIWQISM